MCLALLFVPAFLFGACVMGEESMVYDVQAEYGAAPDRRAWHPILHSVPGRRFKWEDNFNQPILHTLFGKRGPTLPMLGLKSGSGPDEDVYEDGGGSTDWGSLKQVFAPRKPWSSEQNEISKNPMGKIPPPWSRLDGGEKRSLPLLHRLGSFGKRFLTVPIFRNMFASGWSPKKNKHIKKMQGD